MATNFDRYIELLTNSDSTDFPDSDKLIYANIVYRELMAVVNEIDPTKYHRTSHADFTANQNNFSLPDTSGVPDLVAGQVLGIWVKYSSDGNWVQVNFFPKDQINLNTTYSASEPVGWWEKNNFYINPQTDTTITNGIKITFSDRVSDLTAITDDPVGIDKEFWELIPLGVAYKYLFAHGEYNKALSFKREFEDMKKGMINKIQSRESAPTLKPDSNYSLNNLP